MTNQTPLKTPESCSRCEELEAKFKYYGGQEAMADRQELLSGIKVAVESLEMAHEVLEDRWFISGDGDEYNDDEVIEADKKCVETITTLNKLVKTK